MCVLFSRITWAFIQTTVIYSFIFYISFVHPFNEYEREKKCVYSMLHLNLYSLTVLLYLLCSFLQKKPLILSLVQLSSNVFNRVSAQELDKTFCYSQTEKEAFLQGRSSTTVHFCFHYGIFFVYITTKAWHNIWLVGILCIAFATVHEMV